MPDSAHPTREKSGVQTEHVQKHSYPPTVGYIGAYGTQASTVEPLYSGQPWAPQKVAVLER